MKVHPALWIPIVLWGSLAQARTYVVNSGGTGDFPNIQAAINAAAPGDTVALADGVFTGNGNRDISFLGKAVVLRSLSGNPAGCVIDAQGSATGQHRVLAFTNAEGPGAVVDGVTARGGYYAPGGGIYVDANAGPTFHDCVITGNSLGGGMGVTTNSYPTLVDCVISNNQGRGIGNDSSPMTSSQVTVIHTLFQNNDGGTAHGGGLALAGPNQITDCTFVGNQAWGGGGFFTCGGPLGATFSGCTFVGNVATEWSDSLHASNGGGGFT